MFGYEDTGSSLPLPSSPPLGQADEAEEEKNEQQRQQEGKKGGKKNKEAAAAAEEAARAEVGATVNEGEGKSAATKGDREGGGEGRGGSQEDSATRRAGAKGGPGAGAKATSSRRGNDSRGGRESTDEEEQRMQVLVRRVKRYKKKLGEENTAPRRIELLKTEIQECEEELQVRRPRYLKSLSMSHFSVANMSK